MTTRPEGAERGRPAGPATPELAGAQRPDLARITFAVLAIGLLIAASLWILRPFIGPTIWAAMVVVATWPLMRRVERRLGGHRAGAVVVMTLLLLLVFAVPLLLAILTIVQHAEEIVEWVRKAAAYRPTTTAPAWIRGLPVVGERLALVWAQLVAAGVEGAWARLSPYAGNLTRWFVAEVGSIGVLALQFLLTLIISAVMYAHGDDAAALVRRFARRLAGERGESTVQLAAAAIRGVALGIGVTALVQAVLAGIGLELAGIPFAGVLTAVMFILCIAQIGPLPVLVPALIWLYWDGRYGWGTLLLVVAIVVVTLDNVLRPLLIRMGADLPLLLIFAGVIGGLFAFGLVGIFVGPVVLAVGYTLLEAWTAEAEGTSPLAADATPQDQAGEDRRP